MPSVRSKDFDRRFPLEANLIIFDRVARANMFHRATLFLPWHRFVMRFAGCSFRRCFVACPEFFRLEEVYIYLSFADGVSHPFPVVFPILFSDFRVLLFSRGQTKTANAEAGWCRHAFFRSEFSIVKRFLFDRYSGIPHSFASRDWMRFSIAPQVPEARFKQAGYASGEY